MAMVQARCPGCNQDIQLDGRTKTGFCMYCGAKFAVNEAIQYLKGSGEYVAGTGDGAAMHGMDEVERLLEKNSFTMAERYCRERTGRDPEDWEARWGTIRAATRNLEPERLDTPDDFLWSEACALFENAPVQDAEAWRERYMNAYLSALRATAESYDPRVFIEVSVYKWNVRENRFETPVDRNFPIELHVDKSVRAHLDNLAQVLPPELRREADGLIDRTCADIAACFRSGFENLDGPKAGKFEKLLGVWAVKHAAGELKTELIRVYKNDVGVVYCETMRTSISRLDYFRFVGMDPNGSLTCRELRRFPSRSGTGGDFLSFSHPKAFQLVFALYDFLLVLPNGLFSRVDPAEAPGYEKALAFQRKCCAAPCFVRDGTKSVQIRPAAENHNNAEPSRKVSSCYIATAVYGDVDEPHVRTLRRFRDDVLHKSAPGRRISAAYYRLSPPLAERLRRAGAVNRVVRAALNAFVALLRRIYPES